MTLRDITNEAVKMNPKASNLKEILEGLDGTGNVRLNNRSVQMLVLFNT